MVQAAEATAEQTHIMSREHAVCVVQINSGRGQGHKGRGGLNQLRDYAKKQKKPTTECKFCSYEHAPKQRPAYGKECRKCGKQVQAAASDSEYNGGTLSVFSVGNRRRAMITLNLGDSGVPVLFQIDSGSGCCVLPRHKYVRVTGDRTLAKLKPVKTVIVTLKKGKFYIAQYPVHRTAQSGFTHYFPGRPVQSNTISTSLGSIQPHATINVRKAARTHTHHCLLPGTHLYS